MLQMEFQEKYINPFTDFGFKKLFGEENGQIFIYLEMPNFVKKESELASNFDKWMFLLKNISLMRDKPEVLKEIVFGRFLDAAELAAYTPEERWQYEQSLKHYRDMRNVVTTAYDDGKSEGREEGKKEGRNEVALEIASSLLAEGLPIDKIAVITKLSVEDIIKLLS